MASLPGEEAAVAPATPAASRPRLLSALRGFGDRLVDECRVEVREMREHRQRKKKLLTVAAEEPKKTQPLPLLLPLPKNKKNHQLPLLRRHWWIILLCLAFQYVHGVFTQLSYVLARPEPQPLPDLGFTIIPELPLSADWVSESLFYAQFFGGIAWMFSPFIMKGKYLRHTTIGLASAALPALVLAQALRIASFTSTRLPSPAPHCLSSSPVAVKPRPDHWWQYVAVNVVTQASKSCGDLIFSSHLTFALSFCILYTLRGNFKIIKIVWWTAAVALSLLIVASRKHYSVDIVVAWYAVPLIFFGLCRTRRWSRLSGRRVGDGGREGGKDSGGGRGVVVERRDEAAERKKREEEEELQQQQQQQRREANGTTPAATTELTEVRVVDENGASGSGNGRERGGR